VTVELPRRIVLIGFMGCGKSTVGRLLADALGWRFEDLDQRIEVEVGRSVPEIFAEEGEEFFRRLEGRLADSILGRDDVVLATGGGWAARPGRLSEVPDGTLTVWLQVSAEEAVRRVRGAPGTRPLLDVPDPLDRARTMMAERGPRYAAAACVVDTEGLEPIDVSRRILALLGAKHDRTR
jgi:shikimate kinase